MFAFLKEKYGQTWDKFAKRGGWHKVLTFAVFFLLMALLKIPENYKSYNFPSPKLEYLLRVFEGFPNGIFFDQVK